MTNKFYSIFFLILLVFPFCSSIQIEMNSSYNAGESFIAKVSGNFLEPIYKSDISFYRRHMPTVIDFSVISINSDYYIYGQIPLEKIPDNYSILLSKVKSLQGGNAVEEDLFYNFSISNETAEFSILPLALSANLDFTLFVQSFEDKQITLKGSLLNETESSGGFFSFFEGGNSKEVFSFSLNPGESKNIEINSKDFQNGMNLLKLSSNKTNYIVYVDFTKEEEKPKFYFEEKEINLTLLINNSESKKVFVHNSGEELIKNISLSLSKSLEDYVIISKKSIKEIKSDSTIEVTLTFFSEEEINLEGFLKAEKEDKVSFLPIYFSSVKNISSVKENVSEENETNTFELPKTCSEIGGTPCGEGFNCTGEIVEARDDRCCIGECKEITPSISKKIIGWILLIAGVIILAWFLINKYFGTKNKVKLPSVLRR